MWRMCNRNAPCSANHSILAFAVAELRHEPARRRVGHASPLWRYISKLSRRAAHSHVGHLVPNAADTRIHRPYRCVKLLLHISSNGRTLQRLHEHGCHGLSTLVIPGLFQWCSVVMYRIVLERLRMTRLCDEAPPAK